MWTCGCTAQASFNTSSGNAGAPPTVTNTTPWEALPPRPNSASYGTLDFQVRMPAGHVHSIAEQATCRSACLVTESGSDMLYLLALPVLAESLLRCWANHVPCLGLTLQATGTGEATVSASLLFVPSVLPAFPAYRGLYVEAALQLVDPRSGGPTGRRVAAVPLASTVALTVQLTSPDDLGAVTLEVMMPGGLEPLDPNLASGADLGPTCGADVGGSTSSWTEWYSWWWWPVCPAQVGAESRTRH